MNLPETILEAYTLESMSKNGALLSESMSSCTQDKAQPSWFERYIENR